MKIALVAMTFALTLLPCAASTTAAEQVTSFGVRAVAIDHPFQTATTSVAMARVPAGRVEQGAGHEGYLLDDSTNSSLYALFDLLKAGVRADRLTGGGQSAGTIYIPDQAGLQAKLFFNALLEPSSTPVALSNGAMSRN